MEFLVPVIFILASVFVIAGVTMGADQQKVSEFEKGSVSYDGLASETAFQIVESWFPHDETELIDGAPFPMCGRFSKNFYRHSFRQYGEITLEVFFKRPKGASFLSQLLQLKDSKVSLLLKLEQYQRSLQMRYIWIGPTSKIHDLFSPEYKVLKYLVDRLELEFAVRGYQPFELVGDKQRKKKAFAAPMSAKGLQKQYLQAAKDAELEYSKQWGRAYVAGSQAGRIYGSWPNPQDFAESVQNPEHNINDAELKNCQPALNALGIPKVASGMFASVYEMRNAEKRWALRCFNTKLKDQNERYKAISSFILQDDLPYTVDFYYLEDGIKCGDAWYPILKMTWVEGQTLDSYVRDKINQPSALLALRQELGIMMEKLRANDVAHGDLQHGNILIKDQEIFLVDYDGFYVPELAGRQNNELGHPNYQHPGRKAEHFGPYLDNFSAWVIDLSLLALAEDGALFERVKGGDECLLFRRADFLNPKTSQLFAALLKSESARVRDATQNLLEFLSLPLEKIPYLSLEGQELKISEAEKQAI